MTYFHFIVLYKSKSCESFILIYTRGQHVVIPYHTIPYQGILTWVFSG